MATRFSYLYPTFSSWLHAKKRTSRYSKAILTRHNFYRDLSLNNLIKLKITDINLSKKAYRFLSEGEKTLREKAIDVLNLLKEGYSFKKSTKKNDISQKDAWKHLGRAIFKRFGRIFPKKYDFIERPMFIYEKGQIRDITVRGSKDASLIGEYFEAVRVAMDTGKSHYLKKFRHLKIIDADGKTRTFETNLNKIYEIREQIEHPEIKEDVYHWEHASI